MKLDTLISHDSMSIDPKEWAAYLELGPLRGSMHMTLTGGYAVHDGYYLSFDYRCPTDFTFIGYRVQRNWIENGTHKIRTVRMDVWTPAHVAHAGAVIQVEVIIHPEDWA